jgi:hypothetical protein
MKKLIILIFLFSSVNFAINSQSAYLNKGQGGFGIGGGFKNLDQTSAFYSSLGFSISGMFDIGIITSQVIDNQFDFNATTWGPYTSVFIIKQSETIPVSLSLNGKYIKTFFSTEELRPSDIDLKHSAFSIGTTLSSLVQLTDGFGLQPFMEFSYNRGKGITKSPPSEVVLTSNMSALGVSLIFRNTSKSMVVIEPQYIITNNLRIFDLSLNYIFN